MLSIHPSATPSTTSEAASVHAGEPEAPALAVLDLADLRDRAGGDDDLVLELLGDFIERSTDMQDLASAAAAADFAKTSKLAHRLKGSTLAIGAKATARAASQVEHHASALHAAGAGAEAGSLDAEIAELDARYQDACAAIRAERARAGVA